MAFADVDCALHMDSRTILPIEQCLRTAANGTSGDAATEAQQGPQGTEPQREGCGHGVQGHDAPFCRSLHETAGCLCALGWSAGWHDAQGMPVHPRCHQAIGLGSDVAHATVHHQFAADSE